MNHINQYYSKFKGNFGQPKQTTQPVRQTTKYNQNTHIFQGQNVLSDQILDMKRKIRQLAQKNPFTYMQKYGYEHLMTSQDEYQKIIGDYPIKNQKFPITQPQSENNYYKGKEYQLKRNLKQKNIQNYLQYNQHIPNFGQNDQYGNPQPYGYSSNNNGPFPINLRNFNSQNQIAPLYPTPHIIINPKQLQYDYQDHFSYITQFPNPLIRYKIIPSTKLKMALDVTTVDKDEKLVKGNVIIWDYHGGPNQAFYFKKVNDNNQYYIISVSTGFSMQVPGGSMDNNVQVIMSPRFGYPNEIWTLVPTDVQSKKEFKILSFCGKALDVSNQWSINGNAVIQYDNKKLQESKNQKWIIRPC